MEPLFNQEEWEKTLSDLLKQHSESSTETPSEPTYKCPLCKDTGWLESEYNGYRFVSECGCQRAEKARLRMELSGLKELIHSCTFKTFQPEEPWQETLLQKAREYVLALKPTNTQDAFDSKTTPWFFIGGPPGSGKTHLCTAICGQLLAAGKSVSYMRWLKDGRELKAAIMDQEEYSRLIRRYLNCDVLYIDDLFKSQHVGQSLPTPTEADVKLAFSILDERYLTGKPTVISSEWYLTDELMPTDEATFSRVLQRCGPYNFRIGRKPSRNWRVTHAASTEL